MTICANCKYFHFWNKTDGGVYLCNATRKITPWTYLTGYGNRAVCIEKNHEGKCKDYKKKWWKFYAKEEMK